MKPLAAEDLQCALDLVDVAIATFSPAGILVGWNLGFEQQLSLASDYLHAEPRWFELLVQLRQRGWTVLTSAMIPLSQLQPKDVTSVGLVHPEGQVWQGQITNRPTGGWLWVLRSTPPEPSLTPPEIRDRAELERQLQQALAKEKELTELKSRFVSMTSHEFRTPLSTILSAAELLEYYGHLWSQEDCTEQLHLIQATVQHMTQLLEDILIISQAQPERSLYQPRWINVVDFCQALIQHLQQGMAKHRTIAFTCSDPLFKGWLDETLVRQILTNLISNALKYSPPTLPVSLHVQHQTRSVLFQVSDHGIGIPAEDHARLFEAFHRGTNVGTAPGTGLGLAIVQQCVAAHGGTITFHSQLGQGSQFEVTLPLEVVQDVVPISEMPPD